MEDPTHWAEDPMLLEEAIRQGLHPPADTSAPDAFVFLDESYGEDHYYVAGFVVTPTQLASLESHIRQQHWDLEALHGLDNSAEFHAHEVMQSRGDWSFLGRNVGLKLDISRAILSAAAGSGAASFIEGLDIVRLNARYRYPEPPHLVTMRHLLERVESHAKWKGFRRVKVVADHLDQYPQYLRAFDRYRDNGTPGYRSTNLELIDPDISFADSKGSIGLQVADFIAYFSRRHLEAHEVPDRRARQAARKMFDVIVSMASPTCRSGFKWMP